MSIVDDLMECAEYGVRRIYAADPKHELMAMFHCRPQSGPDLVIATPWRNEFEKVAVLAKLRTIFRERGIVAYASIGEAWCSMSTTIKPRPDGSIPRFYPGDPPSQQPDRFEVLMIMATDGTTVKSRAWRMKRDSRGRLLDLEPWGEDQPERAPSTRFERLLNED